MNSYLLWFALNVLLNAIHFVPVVSEWESSDGESGPESAQKPRIGTKDEFRLLLTGRREEQISAVKTLDSFGKYEQKYTMVTNIFEKLFEVQQKAKQTIEDSDYVLGSDLPTEGNQLEALSQVIENCAFFGDIVLRVPDVSHRVLSANHKYEALYKWCISFSVASDLCDAKTLKMFDLLAQELSLVPKDQSYVNPYKKSAKRKAKPDIPRDVVNTNGNNQKNAKRTQKSVKKGPRLSKSRNEL